jgi:hypothetical protein
VSSTRFAPSRPPVNERPAAQSRRGRSPSEIGPLRRAVAVQVAVRLVGAGKYIPLSTETRAKIKASRTNGAFASTDFPFTMHQDNEQPPQKIPDSFLVG